MISDILSEAVSEIDRYLTDKTFEEVYSGELKERIVVLRNNMEEMRKELDDPCEPVFSCTCKGFYKPSDCPVHGTNKTRRVLA